MSEIEKMYEKIELLQKELKKKLVGQEKLVRDLLIWVFSGGHILLEWVPWLAKTLAVSSVALWLHLDFKRIQFTPDLLPSDLIGARVFNPVKNEFYIKKGPIFSNIILADEINRAPAKVQSALLEAMAEKQVTIGEESFILDAPFLVLATQNPIEQDWTYALPEAQMDRFLLKTIVSYPNEAEEIAIMKWDNEREKAIIDTIFTKKEIIELQKHISEITVSDSIYEYVKDIVFSTRKKESPFSKYIEIWVSPRASLALIKAAKVIAYLHKRDFLLPEDIKEVAFSVLRHRIILSYEAIADSIKQDEIIQNILKSINIK